MEAGGGRASRAGPEGEASGCAGSVEPKPTGVVGRSGANATGKASARGGGGGSLGGADGDGAKLIDKVTWSGEVGEVGETAEAGPLLGAGEADAGLVDGVEGGVVGRVGGARKRPRMLRSASWPRAKPGRMKSSS